MPLNPHIALHLIGAFAGVCILMVILSLVVGYAYRERMLWWHAGALIAGLSAQAAGNHPSQLSTTLWLTQLALAAQAFRVSTGATGAMRRPAISLRVVSLASLAVAASGLIPDKQFTWILLPWAGVTVWYLSRTWSQNRPWIYWFAAGQIALVGQWLVWKSQIPYLMDIAPEVSSLAALSIFSISTYLGMVWLSRSRTENALRIEARERIDPLTGLATPRVFFDRVDGALIRSRNLGYACALVLVRIENIEDIFSDQQLENAEPVILAAAKAIANSLRPQDTAARVSDNRFCVMAEGIAEGAGTELATKILAQGLRAGEWGLRGSELRFQIIVREILEPKTVSGVMLDELEEALREMRSQPSPNPIRTLPRS